MRAGAHLELNLLSSLQGALANQGQAFLGSGKAPGRMGNDHPSIVPHQLLDCADAPLAVACGNEGQFTKLARVLGIPDIAVDPRSATNNAGVAHRDELVPILEAALSTGTAVHWQDTLTDAGVPAGHVSEIDEGLEYAQSLGLEPTVEVHDAAGVPVGRQIRNPITWTPPIPVRTEAPPRLGEHDAAVLSWLGDSRLSAASSSAASGG
ncbi:hypothetical protein CVV68_20840 [Arthrobacter livingstonensis]|uniref:CoA transferase n=1 Tax=Arthrobacter livingstonensis TaxID=670078 RepID=A0A2V5L0X4_9MICC|nr:CoA transferase [Arthrobacter livingstonensis]PYI64809.1 hypothetical protein CVV68_20840 [Arthrobacter livingstonensis]